MTQEQKTVTVSIKKILKWLSVIIIVLLISRFGYLLSRNNSSSLRSYSNEIPMITFTDSGSSSSISDTREFMKTSYSGNIKTRDVKNISRDIRGIIRDMDGRIDNEDISEKYGRIDFVIPKSNLDDFRDEIESLVHAKLYTETTSSQNLLNEKKSIENRSDIATKSLSDTQLEKTKLESTYSKDIASLQSQINSTEKKLQEKINQIQILSNADSEIYADQINQISQEINTFRNQIENLRNTITEKNRIYTQERDRLTLTIEQINNEIAAIKKDDISFGEKIETVNGSISIQWVNIWNLVKLVSSIPPFILILVPVIIIWYVLRKLKIIPLFVIKW